MFVHNNLAENRNLMKSRFCWTGATTNLCSADFLKLQRHVSQIVSWKCWNILNRTFMQFQFTPTSGGTTPIICTTHTPIGRQWHIFEPEDGAAACMWTLRPHSLGILNTYTCTLTHQSIDVPWSYLNSLNSYFDEFPKKRKTYMIKSITQWIYNMTFSMVLPLQNAGWDFGYNTCGNCNGQHIQCSTRSHIRRLLLICKTNSSLELKLVGGQWPVFASMLPTLQQQLTCQSLLPNPPKLSPNFEKVQRNIVCDKQISALILMDRMSNDVKWAVAHLLAPF